MPLIVTVCAQPHLISHSSTQAVIAYNGELASKYKYIAELRKKNETEG